MLKVGITGGIGSGKTTVCKVFELQGIPVFYADTEAKAVMQSDTQLIDEIKQAFGNDIYAGGILDRPKLASIVFNNEERLKMLNSLVHPAVFRAFDSWLRMQNAPYIVKEAALLFESGSYKDCDYTVLVKSPYQLKVNRVMARDFVSEAEVVKRMNKQLSDEEKEKLANFTIENDEKQLVIPRVLRLHQQFLNQAAIIK